MVELAPANWYADPYGRYEYRYWDGLQWTEHVGTGGVQGTEAPFAISPAQPVAKGSKKVQRDIRSVGVLPGERVGGGTLFTEPYLVVNQKAKLIEVNAEYAVLDQHGQRVGVVREVGQNLGKKVFGPVPSANLSRRLQVLDMDGQVLMTLTRPTKLLKSKVIVRNAQGVEIGQITQKTLGIIGGVRFALESGGTAVGSITTEDWNAWNFSIQNPEGDEIGRITKTWAGLAKEWFTKGDNYVVELGPPQDEPLRSLIVAAALAVDTALRQAGDNIRQFRL